MSSTPVEAVVHIGTEKTATTTLQALLSTNRAVLARRGVLVPTSAAEGNNWGLAVAAYNDDRRDDLTAAAGIETAEDLTRFRAETIENLRRELDQATASPHSAGPAGTAVSKVVFSSEHLQSRLSTDEEVERLATVLAGIGVEKVTIVIYLRDPAALAGSLHSTLVKHGSGALHPPPPDQPYFQRICNHRATLNQFGAVFGFDRLRPRLFDPGELINRSIVDDFVFTAGLGGDRSGPGDHGLVHPPDALNRALPAAALAVLSRMNMMLDRPLRQGLRAFFEQNSAGPPYRISPQMSEAYQLAFADSNRWVAERFFDNRDPLFRPEPVESAADQWRFATSIEADTMAVMMTELWLEQKRLQGISIDEATVDRVAAVKAVVGSGLWDPAHYLATYPALERNGVVPITHFLHHGGSEGRSPSPGFNGRAYLNDHPGVAETGLNPLVHHLGHRFTRIRSHPS